MNRTQRSFVLALMVASASHADESSSADAYAVPGDRVFPESLDIDPSTRRLFAASAETGTVYHGALGDDRLAVFSEAGTTDGGGFGVRVLPSGDVAVARGASGVVDLFGADGTLRRSLEVENPEGVFLNDVVAMPDGRLFVTDSFRPVVYVWNGEKERGLSVWLDLESTELRYEEGFNLNGIVADPEADALIVAQTNTREFWRIDLRTRRVDAIAIEGGAGGGDGLRLAGGRLFAVQEDGVAVFEPTSDYARATKLGVVRDEAFDGPTGVAIDGGSVFVTNAQFARQGGQPDLPFEIVRVSLPPELLPRDEQEE